MIVIGIDLGTSGARAVAMDEGFAIVAEAAADLADHGPDPRDPAAWWGAVAAALDGVLARIDRARVRALAVDGTSGTVLAVDAAGRPASTPLMYNDPVADAAILEKIASEAPAASAAHGPTSGLAKAMTMQDRPGVARILHQADWIAGRFSGSFHLSDENNALKTGYDPVARRWPAWIARTGARVDLLPEVREPGSPVGTVTSAAAARFGLPADTLVVAGATDGCASFLATGADEPGAGVTALGSSLTIKMLSDVPRFAPEYGIYSHRIGDAWLAGGASNTGGKVLLAHFPRADLADLSQRIDPETDSGLDYYPLLQPGERFPVADPLLAPRLTPRPDDDALFLKGMLEGIAAVEALAYARLCDLGAPALASVRSVGGGAANPVWTRIRQRRLKVPFLAAHSTEAAAGTARLALAGARAAGVTP
ncbi:MAG TPA: FGGY-family carbohydrate kinase [Methylomirabilota bacterium]|nr:FGGY-family carbohydrate kinase [Methylomirabilota bacterium]